MILPDFVVVSFIRLREGCSVLLSACIETGGGLLFEQIRCVRF